LIPDGLGKQALHARGASLSGVFGDLPAVFPGEMIENGFEVEQGVLAGFGAGKAGGDLLVQVA
jgi:hypothetical protein